MKTKARRIVERFGDKTRKEIKPIALGAEAVVVMFPAQTMGYDYYLTARYVRYTKKHRYIEYVCSCPGFKFGADECRHIQSLAEQISSAEALLNS